MNIVEIEYCAMNFPNEAYCLISEPRVYDSTQLLKWQQWLRVCWSNPKNEVVKKKLEVFNISGGSSLGFRDKMFNHFFTRFKISSPQNYTKRC